MRTNDIKISLKDGQDGPRSAAPAPKKEAKPKPKPPAKPPAPGGKKAAGLAKFALAMALPACLVGVGIYLWQQDVIEKEKTSIRQEARETELSFEERLRNLKNKLTGFEDENKALKEQTEAMNRRIALLDKAKIDYRDEELGISFVYPAVFGEITITKSDVASGSKYIGTFSDNDRLVFGGASPDLEPAQEPDAAAALTDTLGFAKERDDYYLLLPGQRQPVSPLESLSTASGQEAILIDKNSFPPDPAADGLPVDIGDNAGLVVNLGAGAYPGMAFVNSDFGLMPLESFKALAATINN